MSAPTLRAMTVLEFLASHDWDGESEPGNDVVNGALAEVAELIAADRAYDATCAALKEHYRDVAENGYLASKFPDGRALGEAFVAAAIRREKALEAMGGGQ